ncbi:MAG TPA: hypothetical protein VLJ37_01345 [bacterium]|nr:hypothetical protein [bacterium]
MSHRKVLVTLMVSLTCAAVSGRLMAKAAQTGGAQCEEAIAQEVKGANKAKKVVFARDARRAIPHGPLTHYAGKGSYVMPGGDRTEFEWFCDINGASGKPANLYYSVSKADAPAAGTRATKDDAVADKAAASECQDAVTSEIRKKNPQISNLAFHSPKEFQAGKEGKLLEGDGSFKDNREEERQFDYRCIYDKLDGKITAKSVQMK